MIVYRDIGIAFPSIVLPKSDIDLSRWAVVACDQHTNSSQYWNEVTDVVGSSPSTLNYIVPEVLGRVEQSEIEKRWNAMRQAVEQRLFVQYANLSIMTARGFVDGTVRYGCMIAIDLERYNFQSDSQPISRQSDCVVPTEETFQDKVQVRVAVRKRALLEFPHILVLYDNPHPSWRQQFQELFNSATPLYKTTLMKDGGTVTGRAVAEPKALHKLTNIITCTSAPFNPSSMLTSVSDTATNTLRHAVYSDDSLISVTSKSQSSPRPKPILYVGDGNHALASAKAMWNAYKQTEQTTNTETSTQFHPLRYALVEAVNIHDSGLKFLPIHQVLTGHTPRWIHDITNAISSLGLQYRLGDDNQLNQLYRQHPTSSIVQVYGTTERFAIVCTTPLPVVAIAEIVEQKLEYGGNRLFVHEWDDAVRLCKKHSGIALCMPQLDRKQVLNYIAHNKRLPKKSFSLGYSAEKRYYLEGRFLIDNDYPYVVV